VRRASSWATLIEMERKRGEYFAAGVHLIWEVDPDTRTVVVYTPDGTVNRLNSTQALDGGVVLTGFIIEIGELFSESDRHG
jgi:Putative restriction endonuclease